MFVEDFRTKFTWVLRQTLEASRERFLSELINYNVWHLEYS